MLRLLQVSAIFLLIIGNNVFGQKQPQSSGATEQPGKTLLKIEAKPDPKWPNIETEGTCTIVLRAVFAADGKVTHISFVKIVPEKPKGFSERDIKVLTKRSIEAAKQIKFVPAMKDNHPVSMWMQLEYNFSPLVDEKKIPNK
jgi:hypothetical protein